MLAAHTKHKVQGQPSAAGRRTARLARQPKGTHPLAQRSGRHPVVALLHTPLDHRSSPPRKDVRSPASREHADCADRFGAKTVAAHVLVRADRRLASQGSQGKSRDVVAQPRQVKRSEHLLARRPPDHRPMHPMKQTLPHNAKRDQLLLHSGRSGGRISSRISRSSARRG